MRKVERVRFLSEGEESDALRINGDKKMGTNPFCKKEDILIQKMGPVPIFSLGQKQHVFEPYCLSLSFKVAPSIPKYSYIMNDYFLIPENLMLTPLD